jgi:hypothetical protein
VQEPFLKNVTLRCGCGWRLAVYVAQVSSRTMVAIGFRYVVLARGGAMTSVTSAKLRHPFCARAASLRSFWPGSPAITPSAQSGRTSTTPRLRPGKVTWLGLQAVCIAIYVVGVMCASGDIKRALLTARPPVPLRAS